MKKLLLLIVLGISINMYGQEDMLCMGHHLGLNIWIISYNNGYREDFVTLLSQEQLKVFSKENPIPSDALEGNEAAIKYLKMD